VVVLSESREAVEEFGVVRVFDVGFDGEHALGLDQLVEAELQAKQLDIGCLVVARALEQRSEDAHRRFQHAAAIADDVGADGGA